MSKAAKANNPATCPGESPPFEEALKKLESIVEAMESDELPLEALLARFEEGTRLVQICQAKLAEAEVKIQQLEKNAAGDIVLKPLAVTVSSSED
jgi:exodeoxyribonuclease VII small subunit